MQIFTLFDAQMRGFRAGRKPRSDFHIGFQSRVLAACAGLGHTCDCIFLRAGETQNEFVTKRHEWWACLRGGIRIAAPEQAAVLIGGGDIFAPAAGQLMQVQTMIDSILVRVMPAGDCAHDAIVLPADARDCAQGRIASVNNAPARRDDAADALRAGSCRAQVQADFVMLAPGEEGWGSRLHARGLRWALCYGGALSLRWRSMRVGAGTQLACLQPGAVFAPEPQDAFEVEVMPHGSRLLCCVRPDLRSGGISDGRPGNAQPDHNERRRESSRREAEPLPG